MEPLLQKRIQRYGWDKAASYYEPYWQTQLEPAQSKLLDMIGLRPGEQVIDIAAGSGALTFRIAASVEPGGSVFATDISDSMTDLARRFALERKISNVQFEQMDAEALEVKEGTYDVAICSLGLMYVPDPLQAIKEMHRVLKSGGRAVAAVWGQRNRCGWAEIFPIVERRVKSEVCPLFFQLGSGLSMQNTFQHAGFCSLETQRMSTQLHYTSAEEACGAAFAGGPVALAYSRFDEKMRTEAFDEYLNSLAAFRSGPAYDIPGEFVITVGYKE